MNKKIRIGCASGFWGDTDIAAPQIIEKGNVDYLACDYLSEVTMSILSRAKLKSSENGYAKDFINHEKLKVQKEGKIERRLVGLELIDKGIARNGYSIFSSEDIEIGMVTSGTMSPTLNKAIAMGYVAKEFSDINSSVFIQIRNKKIKSKVVRLPFVKNNEGQK